jgi:hypothetical protein
MKTRLIFITAIILLFTTIAYSQDKGKISFGVLGGINFQNLNGKAFNGDKLENELILGYHAGVNVQIPIVPQFYFQPGLLFSTKGAKNVGSLLTFTTHISYMELPLNLVYKGSLGNGKVLLGAGPYIGYAIMGKVITEGSIDSKSDIRFQKVVETLDDPTVPYYKALDVGGNIFFGYQLASGLFAQLNAQLGMVKINPEYKILTDDKSIIKNTGFGVSIGYQF